jgi:hypothetical protein
METQIQEYNQTAAALADLASRFKGVIYDVTKPADMDAARKARAEIRTYRTGLEAKRVEIKSPALERCRLIDAEAKRITAALVELEDPIDAQIKAEENRKEAEKQAAIRAEQARIEAEQRAIREAEEGRLAAERTEIARRKAELDRAEHERLSLERQARERIEVEEREARARIQAAEDEARKVRLAEEDRLRAEREAVDRARREQEEKAIAERREAERQERLAQQARDDVARQKRQQEVALADARGMLALFVEHYGKIEEFEQIVKAIRTYQRQPK